MQEQRESKTDYWGRFSWSYDEKVDRLIGKRLRPALARKLENEPSPGDVLEIGCGTGYFTQAVAKHAKHVTATDLSPAMVEAAKRNLTDFGNVSFRVENGEAISFLPETFDTVLLANVLHTFDDPRKALGECYRVLKPGGTLLVINYTDEGMRAVKRTWLLFRFAVMFGFPPKKGWPVKRERLRQLLAAAGFKIERLGLLENKINTIYCRASKSSAT
jgi:Methylase involved in ubiquinone/menaquinone biosynthesis